MEDWNRKDNERPAWALTDKELFAGKKKPSMKRRSNINNYYGKHIYMITLAVEGRRPLLGTLKGRALPKDGNDEPAWVEFSELGRAIRQCWRNIPTFYPEVKLIAFQMMPDHLHGILQITNETSNHLGKIINGFKTGCNKEYRKLFAEALPLHTQSHNNLKIVKNHQETEENGYAYEEAALLQPNYQSRPPRQPAKGLLFELGYNDLICKSYDMLPRMIQYVKDNPRRLAIKREHPDYFRVRFDIEINGQTFAAIGNRFLLDFPDKEQVQLSRKLTDEQIQQKTAEFLEMGKYGTVLVSPAISPGEQAVMRAALDAKQPLIFLTPWGFTSFSKPGHQYFEACAEGRFLILAPWPHQNEKMPLTREMCMELNEMAKGICMM